MYLLFDIYYHFAARRMLGIWRDVIRRRCFTLLRHCIHVIVMLLKRPLNDHIVSIPTYTLYKVYTFNCYQFSLIEPIVLNCTVVFLKGSKAGTDWLRPYCLFWLIVVPNYDTVLWYFECLEWLETWMYVWKLAFYCCTIVL